MNRQNFSDSKFCLFLYHPLIRERARIPFGMHRQPAPEAAAGERRRMETNQNLEELKESTETVLGVVTSNDLYYGLLLLAIMFVILKVIDLAFKPWQKNRSVLISFAKACLKAFVMVTFGMRILSLIPGISEFTHQILLSSSLIVVVMGFVFQEGLSNIVHGFILSAFRPFRVGDRIHITVDGTSITGFIETINARHTVILNVVNSSHVIVPNAKMDTCIIENNHFDGDHTTSAFLDVSITYESDLDLAIKIIRDLVENHPSVKALREENNITDPIMIMVRDLGESGIELRATVVTKTVNENFAACSDLRYSLVQAFAKEPRVSFAYPHMHLVAEDSNGGNK